MRRRLWWQILIMDSRSAQLSGAAIDAHFHLFWNTKRPLNVNDADLSPAMRDLPKEHEGVTEMLFCSIRFEVGECMLQLKSLQTSALTGRPSIAQQDRAIDELENRIESRFLKKCDPSIPLHLLATYLGRAAICSMRLSAHHPRQDPDKGASLLQNEKDMLFTIGLQVLVYDHLAYSTKSIEGYLWHVIMQFQFEAFILVLTELLSRVEGEAVDRAWMQVNQVYEDHPDLITNTRSALYYAMGNLTLKAWNKRVEIAGDDRMSYQPVEPPSISMLRIRRQPKYSQSTPGVSTDAISSRITPGPGHHNHQSTIDVSTSVQLSANMPFPIEQGDLGWEYWQNLLDGRGEPLFDSHEQHFW